MFLFLFFFFFLFGESDRLIIKHMKMKRIIVKYSLNKKNKIGRFIMLRGIVKLQSIKRAYYSYKIEISSNISEESIKNRLIYINSYLVYDRVDAAVQWLKGFFS